jgi:hypothetical protein
MKALVPPSGYLLSYLLLNGLGIQGIAQKVISIVAGAAWYMYDVAYVTANNKVIEKGFETPFLGGGSFGKGRVTEKILGGAEKFVGLVVTGLMTIVLLSGAFLAHVFAQSATGDAKNVLTWTTYIAGGLGALLGARLGFAIFKPGDAPAAALPPFPGIAKPASTEASTETATEAATEAATTNNTVQSGGGVALTVAAVAEEVLRKYDAAAFPMEAALFIGALAAISLAGIAFAVYRRKQKRLAEQEENNEDVGNARPL